MIQEVEVDTVKTWRNWFEKNHKKENKVKLISNKKSTGKPSISHKESMEVAICFGWIDTTLKKIDEEKYERNFVKRTDKSRWSNNTLSYAKDMIKKGLITPHGLKRYKEGLKKPTIDLNLPPNHISEELKKIFSKSKKKEEQFYSFSPSRRKGFIHIIERAKRPETRIKRVAEIMKLYEAKCKP